MELANLLWLKAALFSSCHNIEAHIKAKVCTFKVGKELFANPNQMLLL